MGKGDSDYPKDRNLVVATTLKAEAIFSAAKALPLAESPAEKAEIILRLQAYLLDPTNPSGALDKLKAEDRYGLS
jgi:hypothetical protein